MSKLHIFHKWHLVWEKSDISWEVMRWDSKRVTTTLLTARFVCRCGQSKIVITDKSYGDNADSSDPTWKDALFYEN